MYTSTLYSGLLVAACGLVNTLVDNVIAKRGNIDLDGARSGDTRYFVQSIAAGRSKQSLSY